MPARSLSMAPSRGRPVGERGRVASDDGQGRPEVVAEVDEELALASAGAGELVGECVDPRGRLPHLARADDRQRGPDRRARDDQLVRPLGEPRERSSDRAGQDEGEWRTDDQRHEDDDRQRPAEIAEGLGARPVDGREQDGPRRGGVRAPEDERRVVVELPVGEAGRAGQGLADLGRRRDRDRRLRCRIGWPHVHDRPVGSQELDGDRVAADLVADLRDHLAHLGVGRRAAHPDDKRLRDVGKAA